MDIKIIRKKFICKECFRKLCGINIEFFNKVYKGNSLCVTCRKEKGKTLTESERGCLWAERTLYI